MQLHTNLVVSAIDIDIFIVQLSLTFGTKYRKRCVSCNQKSRFTIYFLQSTKYIIILKLYYLHASLYTKGWPSDQPKHLECLDLECQALYG